MEMEHKPEGKLQRRSLDSIVENNNNEEDD